MTTLRKGPAPALDADAMPLLHAILEEVRAIRAVLDRTHGPRDAADAALITHIADSIGARSFTSGDLMAHAAADADLRDALEAADVENAWSLGILLARVAGCPVHGLRVVRLNPDAKPACWRIDFADSESGGREWP